MSASLVVCTPVIHDGHSNELGSSLRIGMPPIADHQHCSDCIAMSNLTIFLQALFRHPLLKSISVSQLLDFLTQASALKRHIILAQPAGEPTDSALLILPSLICEFLANTTRIALQAVQDAWDVLKDDAWAMSPLAECVAKEKEAFRKFGWAHGFSMCGLIWATGIELMMPPPSRKHF